MPDYRTPMPGILALTLETAINRILALDEDSAARLQRLDNRMLRLDLEGIGITIRNTNPTPPSAARPSPSSRWRPPRRPPVGAVPNPA
jgi:hypothetical protein